MTMTTTRPSKKYILVDLDSTICDIDHRLPLICQDDDFTKHRKDQDWTEFFARCVDDKPIEEVIEVVRSLYLDYDVVMVTGRSDEVRQQTKNWLDLRHVPFDQLLMRPAGSRVGDEKLKKQLIEDAGIHPDEVLFALEDRKRVVDMWRSLGIRTLQVADGDF